mmetsp:Transcript_32171/g.91280  ORF Transcript_32171/g.91280 Transcript_32171/m.91280 type:complete len:213 (+) Transcript_32171:456-1094(+)
MLWHTLRKLLRPLESRQCCLSVPGLDVGHGKAVLRGCHEVVCLPHSLEDCHSLCQHLSAELKVPSIPLELSPSGQEVCHAPPQVPLDLFRDAGAVLPLLAPCHHLGHHLPALRIELGRGHLPQDVAVPADDHGVHWRRRICPVTQLVRGAKDFEGLLHVAALEGLVALGQRHIHQLGGVGLLPPARGCHGSCPPPSPLSGVSRRLCTTSVVS